jgi:hypothetical protein
VSLRKAAGLSQAQLAERQSAQGEAGTGTINRPPKQVKSIFPKERCSETHRFVRLGQTGLPSSRSPFATTLTLP